MEKSAASTEEVLKTTPDVERGACCARVTRPRLMSMLKLSALAAVALAAGWALGWPLAAQLAGVAALGYLAAAGGTKWVYIALVTLPRDTRALCKYIGLLAQVKWCERKNLTLPAIFAQNVAKHPDKPCLIMDDQQLTFQQVDEASSRCCHVLRANGVRMGDVVALAMSNRPEFVCAWLGVAKAGGVAALINTNLRRGPLTHSLAVAKCRLVIAGKDMVDAVSEVTSTLAPGTTLLAWDATVPAGEFIAMAPLLAAAPATTPEPPQGVGYHDRLLYIYTSGTTGLPKAAVITTARFVFMAAGIAWLAGFKRSDRMYTPLPLYHTAGGVMSVGQALISGNTVVLRARFSASAFFADCRKHQATVAQYIGEMARYVLATPPSAQDRQHDVRLMFGNGLRPQIWPQFVERFGISKIAEFYGATEGNANIVNIDNTVGAIGFLSRIIPGVYPISIIRVDPATGEPLRDARGLCTVCRPNEPGVFVGKIVPGNPTRAFLGYVDQAASDKKVVRDVFSRGDSAFLSGDILVSDERGYLFFRDRTGDTFRWKGENVSTSEVEAVLSNLIGYRDVVVYGVQVGQMEGRAGMAAVLDAEGTLDVAALGPAVCGSLPPYARPIVLRALGKMDLTEPPGSMHVGDWRPFVYGGLASCVAEFGTFPIDTCKTRLQLQAGRTGRHRGMLHALVDISRTEGLRALYAGMGPAVLRQATYGTGKFGSYYTLKRALAADQRDSPALNVACAAVAGAASSAAANPTDVLKVRMQATGRARSLLGCFREVYHNEGLAGLWRGAGPTAQRAAVIAAVELPVYDHCKLRLTAPLGDTPANHLLSSFIASLGSAVASTPIDVVRTRLMNQVKLKSAMSHEASLLLYRGSLDCLVKTVRGEGVLALYKGFIPTWVRMGPWNIIFFLTYEQLKRLY